MRVAQRYPTRVALGIVVAAFLLCSSAKAEDGQFAPLTLFLNEVESDTATVLVRDDAHVLVTRDDLLKAGMKHIPAVKVEEIEGKVYVPLDALAPGVSFRFDEKALTLRITASPEYFGNTVINLRGKAPQGTVRYKDTGFFLNYAPQLIDLRTPGASGEVGLSVGGALLFSGVSYVEGKGVVRGLSNITADEPQLLRRWIVGDVNVSSGGPLSGSAVMGAVSVGRAFQLDPYFVQAPLAQTSGTVVTPSVLDVYVNGQLVRSEPVSPGSFALQNIPLTTGQGTTRYVLRDSFGRQTQIVSNFYFSSGVLAKGITDYSFAVGAIRQNVGTSNFNYGGGLAMAGDYRVGLSDSVTLAWRSEAVVGQGDTRPSGGPGLTIVAPTGQFDLGLAGSMAHDGNGAAASASYIYTSRTFSTGVVGRGMTPGYSNLSQGTHDNRDLFDASVNVSIPVSRWGTLTTNYTLAKSRDSGLSGQIGVQASALLSRSFSLGANVSRILNADGSAPFSAMLSLNVQVGRDVTAALSGQITGPLASTELDVSKAAPLGSGVGGRVSVTQSDQTHVAIGATAQSQLGQADVTGDYLDGRLHSMLTVAGAVVVVARAGVFFTRPVQDGYAVIQVPGAKNVRGYLSNTEVGRTDSNGNMVVPNLLSYYGNALSVNDSDLPMDYRIEGGQQIAAPSFRGPAVVRFDAKKTSFVRGIVTVRQGGRDIVPAYGELTLTIGKDGAVSPLARLGEFEFEGLAAGTYPALIEYAEGVCRFSLTIPVPTGPVVDVGTVQCVAP